MPILRKQRCLLIGTPLNGNHMRPSLDGCYKRVIAKGAKIAGVAFQVIVIDNLIGE